MSNSSHTDINIIQALNDIVTQNRYSALQSMRLTYNYDPSSNIELWLRLFEAKANKLSLDDRMKLDQLPSYLPVNIAQWVLSNSALDTWAKTKKALIDTFGIPVVQQKQACRAKLESLRQGNLPSRQFKAVFESIVQELPENTSLPAEVLRSIYLRVMSPRLLDKIIGNINSKSTWTDVADKAIAMDEVLSADPYLAQYQLYGDPSGSTSSMPLLPHQPNGPAPMEIDALQHRPSSRGSSSSGPRRAGFRHNNDNKSGNQFNQWARPGVPICGHCGREGHLSKRCYQAKKKNQIHTLQQVHSVPSVPSVPAPVVPPVVPPEWSPYSASSGAVSNNVSVNYAVMPESEDPLLPQSNPQDAIHSLTYLSQPVNYKGVNLKCKVNGMSTTCLVDTGATISALHADLATSLKLGIDTSKKLDFTTATGENASTLGCAKVLVLLGEIPLHLECHVVNQLAHPLILGFNDMRAHKAIIDTYNGTIHFPGPGSPGSPGSPGPSGPPGLPADSTFAVAQRFVDAPWSCLFCQVLK